MSLSPETHWLPWRGGGLKKAVGGCKGFRHSPLPYPSAANFFIQVRQTTKTKMGGIDDIWNWKTENTNA